MRDALGYERFAAQGGDWGALVTAQLGHKYPELLYGIHESLTGVLDFDYTALKEEDYSADEEGWFQRTQQQMATTVSHMTVHSTEPHA